MQGTDFTKRKKDTYTIVLGTNELCYEISILPPTKSIHDGLINVAGYIDQAAEGTLDFDNFEISECLEFISNAMSHNTTMRRVSVKHLESIEFDMSDMSTFIAEYLFFITELAKAKN